MAGSTLSAAEFGALVSGVHRSSINEDDASIDEHVRRVAPWIGGADFDRVVDAVLRRRSSLGELDAVLADESVTDVLVDGPGTVLVERHGCLEPSGVELDADGVRLLVDRIARHCRPRPERTRPVAHGVLPGGVRATVVLSPTAEPGPVVALRRHRSTGWSLDELAGAHAARLWRALERRETIVVAGPTGSGKTSLVASLLASLDGAERVVVIEDVAELPALPGAVRLESDDRIDFRQLVASSLRLRPDRIVVGEVRGPEAVDVLHALTSGHRGALTTVHAQDGPGAVRRLTLLSGQSDDRVDPALVALHWSEAIDLVVVMRRGSDGRRCVSSVWEPPS